MYPTKPGDTQVYSPLGSFVVEQHDVTRRYERDESNKFGRHKGIALIWTLLIASFVAGSLHNRPIASPTVATVFSTASSGSTPYKE